ncbi:hypothetical protein ONZ43_g3812 [Nemania bipapillata]|uniref:Uncharacterized protein n=1 Tax=Nemania bipapillata TaxID=110536 RepID=A0ACC2IVD6_9PEZI|nr:hypothetical protein ONZ43_g3812 [Nemania bipapillata]
MITARHLATAVLLAQGIAGSVIGRHQPTPEKDTCLETGTAVYLISNDSPNTIIALPIGEDGTLSAGTITPSGGNGSVSFAHKVGVPAAPDGLVSQSSITIAGQHLFAVNAGSNTVSMFTISSKDPLSLTPVGSPASVPGEFPNTVAASTKNSLACVGMSGAVAGISCAPFSAKTGLGRMDTLRGVALDQTTPPVGPTDTIAHAFFSEDESTLLTMVKGDPDTNKTGFVSMLPISQKASCRKGAPAVFAAAQKDMRSTPSGTGVLFGSQVIPGTDTVFASDASFGAVVLKVDLKAGKATTLSAQKIDGQSATCWSAFVPATNTVFVSDVSVPRLVEMSPKNASIISITELADTGASGFIDLKASGAFLYALAPGNGTVDPMILVLDISGGPATAKPIQMFDLKGMAGVNAQGMAIL